MNSGTQSQLQTGIFRTNSLRFSCGLLLLAVGIFLSLQLGLKWPAQEAFWELGLWAHQASSQELLNTLRYLLPALGSGLTLYGLQQSLQGKTCFVPWWLSLGLTIGSYWLLEQLIQIPQEQLIDLRVFASTLQQPKLSRWLEPLSYILPLVLIVLTFIRRPHLGDPVHAALFDSIANPKTGKTLENITWQEFEQLVGETFRRRGFSVAPTQVGADGGVDLVLRQRGKTYLVQCKQWRAFKVSVNVVRELYGVMAAEGAIGGYVVTCGTFTEQAYTFAKGLNLHLIDGAQLNQWITGTTEAPKPSTKARKTTKPADQITQTTPKCPSCGASMQKRQAKRGNNLGKKFWGCSQYPQCRGTRPL